jgi:hypothetical protein
VTVDRPGEQAAGDEEHGRDCGDHGGDDGGAEGVPDDDAQHGERANGVEESFALRSLSSHAQTFERVRVNAVRAEGEVCVKPHVAYVTRATAGGSPTTFRPGLSKSGRLVRRRE